MAQTTRLIERAQRYLVIDHASLNVTVQASNITDAHLLAELLEISVSGAKVKTHQQIPRGEQISLKLSSDDLQGSLHVDATVCWVQLAGVGEWFLGCSFQPQIPELVLDRFAKSGAFDRREDGRHEVAIESIATWELAAEDTRVCIVNISSSGFCLVSPQPGTPGAQVRLKCTNGNDETIISGRCRWQVETDDGFTLGCEFSSSDDYAALRKIQLEVDQLTREKKGLFRRLFVS